MNSMESYHRAMAHHQMSSDQKNVKAIEFGAGSMGIEVQYRPTFRNLGNVVLIRFIRGKDGSAGQAEKKGILTPGDLLVGVGHVDVRGKDLKTVRSLIKEHGRPLTLYFREPPDTSEFTSGSHANRVTAFPCIALGDDTPLSTEFNLMHARSAESVRTEKGTRKKKDVGLDDGEPIGLDSDIAAADGTDDQQQASATEAESAAMAAMIAAGNMGSTTFQVVEDADIVDGHTDSADVVFKAAPLSERWATLRKAERLWVAHQTLSKVFSRGVQIRAHPQDMRSAETRRSLADVVVFGARNNNDDDEEEREPYVHLHWTVGPDRPSSSFFLFARCWFARRRCCRPSMTMMPFCCILFWNDAVVGLVRYLQKFSMGVAGVTSSSSREGHNLGHGTKNVGHITRRSSVGDVPLAQLPFDVYVRHCVVESVACSQVQVLSLQAVVSAAVCTHSSHLLETSCVVASWPRTHHPQGTESQRQDDRSEKSAALVVERDRGAASRMSSSRAPGANQRANCCRGRSSTKGADAGNAKENARGIQKGNGRLRIWLPGLREQTQKHGSLPSVLLLLMMLMLMLLRIHGWLSCFWLSDSRRINPRSGRRRNQLRA